MHFASTGVFDAKVFPVPKSGSTPDTEKEIYCDFLKRNYSEFLEKGGDPKDILKDVSEGLEISPEEVSDRFRFCYIFIEVD